MKNIIVFASGSGSNFEAIVKACNKRIINANVVLLVCDKKDAYAIKRAKRLGIESFVISPKDFATKYDYEKTITHFCKRSNGIICCLQLTSKQ